MDEERELFLEREYPLNPELEDRKSDGEENKMPDVGSSSSSPGVDELEGAGEYIGEEGGRLKFMRECWSMLSATEET